MNWLPWGLSAMLSVACVALLVALWRVRRGRARAPIQGQMELHTERETLFQTLLDATPMALVLYADLGRILYANRAAERLFFEEQRAEGKNFLRLVESGPEAFRPALLGAADEIAGFDVDGQREIYHFARRTFAHAGEPHTLLVVRQLTREVARHEIDVLKRVVRLISHEVNNSLGPVSSLVHSAREILKTGERPERLVRVFSTIEERAQHLTQFLGEYALLAKLPRPRPQETDLASLLSRLLLLYPEAQLVAAPDARGYFDPVQVEQALLNLLKNAREAGGAASDIRLELSALEDGGARICVRDKGSGFSEEALENALLPFYTSKPSGSGVGLSLVREVVDAHGGRLALRNLQTGGAEVTLLFPGRARPLDPAERARLTLTRR